MVTSWLKMSGNGTKGREKTLCLFGGLESSHLLFTQARWLVRIFCTIVQPFVLPMLHPRQDLAFGCSIALQFIGDNHPWHILKLFEELPKKAFSRLFVPSALDQDIQHVAILIHCSPKIMRFPVDLQIHFIHVPFVSTTRATTTQLVGVGLPKCEAPLSHRFIGDDDPALRQKLFNVAKTE